MQQRTYACQPLVEVGRVPEEQIESVRRQAIAVEPSHLCGYYSSGAPVTAGGVGRVVVDDERRRGT